MYAGSFWATFGNEVGSTAFDDTLEREDLIIEELLSENDILLEAKNMNSKLIDFLSKPSVIMQLVQYFTGRSEPISQLNLDDLRRKRNKIEGDSISVHKPLGDRIVASIRASFNRFPFLASEIFALEIDILVKNLAESSNILDELFAVLSMDTIPPQIAFHIEKVFLVLFKKEHDLLFSYFSSKHNFIDNLVNHIASSPILGILQAIGWSELSSTVDIEYLYNGGLIQKLVSLLNPEKNLSSDVHRSVGMAIIDLITSKITNSLMISSVQSPTQISSLIKYMSTSDSYSGISSLSIISALVRHHALLNSEFNQEDSLYSDVDDMIPLPAVISLITESLDDIINILKKVPPDIDIQFGVISPVGEKRLVAVTLLVMLARCNYPHVNSKLVEKNIIPLCIELFFSHPWNNELHGEIDSLVHYILNQPNIEMKKSLLFDSNFVKKCLIAYQTNQIEQEKPKGQRMGYMGHIFSLLLTLNEVSKVDTLVGEHLDKNEDWNKIQEFYLSAQYVKISHVLGGEIPILEAAPSDEFKTTTNFDEFTADMLKPEVHDNLTLSPSSEDDNDTFQEFDTNIGREPIKHEDDQNSEDKDLVNFSSKNLSNSSDLEEEWDPFS